MNIRRFTDTGEWTTRRYLSLLGNILIWAIVAIDAFYLWPTQLHGSTSMVIVSGHSMEPTYFTGDLVIARKMNPSVGDVIVYAPDGFGGSQIVHRIVGGNATDGWVMQGDNNPRVDPFTPKASEIRGVVLVHYANFGRVTVLLLNPIVWALVLLAAVVLLVWWSGDTCEDDLEDKDNDKREDGGDPESEADEEPDLIDRIVEGTEAAVARMVSSGANVGAAALAVLTRPAPAPRHAAHAPRRAAPAYLRVSAIVAVLGLMAVFGPTPAFASSLGIATGGNIFTKTYTPCTTAALTATPATVTTGTNYRKLVVSAIPPACNSKPITMYAYSSTGILLMSSAMSTSLVTTGTVTFTKNNSGYYDAAQIAKVYVFIDTWGIQTTWTPPSGPFTCIVLSDWTGNWPPPATYGTPTGATCTATMTDYLMWNGTNFKMTFEVTGASNWRVTINLADPVFNGFVPNVLNTWGNPAKAPGYSCSQLPVFVGQKYLPASSNIGYIDGNNTGSGGGNLCP